MVFISKHLTLFQRYQADLIDLFVIATVRTTKVAKKNKQSECKTTSRHRKMAIERKENRDVTERKSVEEKYQDQFQSEDGKGNTKPVGPERKHTISIQRMNTAHEDPKSVNNNSSEFFFSEAAKYEISADLIPLLLRQESRVSGKQEPNRSSLGESRFEEYVVSMWRFDDCVFSQLSDKKQKPWSNNCSETFSPLRFL